MTRRGRKKGGNSAVFKKNDATTKMRALRSPDYLAMSHLPRCHPYSHDKVMENPKGNHRLVVDGVETHLLHTGGFLRCATKACRHYWCLQNTSQHTTADWKVHFSIHLDDLDKAWNACLPVFLGMPLLFGMKVSYMTPEQWSPTQRGRELTVYMFTHDASYETHALSDLPELELRKHQEQPGHEWARFVKRVDRNLARAGVRTRGCAHGDLPWPGSVYASLRNEAFVRGDANGREWVYPPNHLGWNAAGHPLPAVRVCLPLSVRISSSLARKLALPLRTHRKLFFALFLLFSLGVTLRSRYMWCEPVHLCTIVLCGELHVVDNVRPLSNVLGLATLYI